MKVFQFPGAGVNSVDDSFLAHGDVEEQYVIRNSRWIFLRSAFGLNGYGRIVDRNQEMLIAKHKIGEIFYLDVNSGGLKTIFSSDENDYYPKLMFNELLILESSEKTPRYVVNDIREGSHYGLHREDYLRFVDRNLEVYSSNAGKYFYGLDRNGKLLWEKKFTNRNKYYDLYQLGLLALHSKPEHGITSIELIDCKNGENTCGFRVEGKVLELAALEGCIYIRTTHAIEIFDLDKNEIVVKLSPGYRIGAMSYNDTIIAVITKGEPVITLYDRNTFELINQVKILDFTYDGGSFALTNEACSLRLKTDNPEEEMLFSWIGVIPLDELLSAKELSCEPEPAHYLPKEVADPLSGSLIEISFTKDLSFDDLFRHASTGIQTIAYRNAYYEMNPAKPVNENFNGKLVVNFSGYTFTAEEKRLLEELCQRCTEFLDRMLLRAADKTTPITVTSIIPV